MLVLFVDRMKSASTPHPKIRTIEFHRTKYGRELLIDVIRTAGVRSFDTQGAPHVLSFYEIFLVTRGRGTLTLEGSTYAVRPGTVFFTSPGQPRQWLARNLDGLCLFFTADFVEDFFKDPLFLFTLPYFHRDRGDLHLALSPAEGTALAARLRAMQREIRKLRADSPHALRAALYELLIQLSRAFEARAREAPRENAIALRLRRLIELHFRENHRPAAYARRLKVTVGHLNHLARRHLGRSAGIVIRERIALEAKRQLLHTDAAAAEVAYSLGFMDPAYFARFFRRETGVAPSRFRTAPSN